jgi:serine/threonine-protein kinase
VTTKTDGEEARARLQERMATLFKVMFFSFVALLGFLGGMYAIYYDELPHTYIDFVFGGAVALLALMAFLWRIVLVRGKRTLRTLHGLDLVYSVVVGAAFGASAFLQRELHPAGYLSIVYSTFTVYARALIVPSSAQRTAVASAATFAPMIVAALVLAFTSHQELPGPAFFLGCLGLSAMPIVLSAFGSWTIYGLRRKLDAAMQLGKYTTERKLGAGGMGTVYLAHHVLLRGRPIAIKVIQPEKLGSASLARFEREVQATSKLTHPNTVAVYDYARSPDGTFYYAMEYLDGLDLEELVRREGKQASDRVASILEQVCGALSEAHANDIIHRDIKPQNIILCERGLQPDVAKVVDFGLAKEITNETGQSTEMILGTPAYLAPEVMTDPKAVGPRSDLYALGAVGYFLLAGKRMFAEAKTTLDICVHHMTKVPKRPSEIAGAVIDRALEDLVMQCLAKDPAERPESAEALAEALRALPRRGNWSDDEARDWWGKRHAALDAQVGVAEMPTQTITVELGERVRSA